jgi:hypothetical protein
MGIRHSVHASASLSVTARVCTGAGRKVRRIAPRASGGCVPPMTQAHCP